MHFIARLVFFSPQLELLWGAHIYNRASSGFELWFSWLLVQLSTTELSRGGVPIILWQFHFSSPAMHRVRRAVKETDHAILGLGHNCC